MMINRDIFSAVAILLLLLLPIFVQGTAIAGVVERLNVGKVALTFDACETTTPSYFDEKILQYLIKERIPVTIFMTGKFANRNQRRLQEIAGLTFIEIENHSYNHYQHMENLGAGDVWKEVTDLDELMRKMIGKGTKYFRFPAGYYDTRTLKLIENMNLKVVHWTFPSGDPDKNVTTSKLVNWVVSKTKQGDILIFHINGRGYKTGEALPVIIASLREKGIKFVKLEDGMIGGKGNERIAPFLLHRLPDGTLMVR